MGNMRQKITAELLKLQGSDLADRTPFCPDDQRIAEYFDGGLKPLERDGLEGHLAECRHCRARVGVLQRVLADSADQHIPGDVLSDAKRMAGSSASRRFKSAPAWAAAAVLLAVTSVMVVSDRSGAPPAETGPNGTETRQVRSVNSQAGAIRILNPLPRAEVRPGARLEWATVPDSLYYDVYVLTAEGDVIVVQRVWQADWVLDQSHFTEDRASYYFRVVAYMPDGRKLQSRHVPFELQW